MFEEIVVSIKCMQGHAFHLHSLVTLLSSSHIMSAPFFPVVRYIAIIPVEHDEDETSGSMTDELLEN